MWSLLVRFLTSATSLSQPALDEMSLMMYSHFPGPSLVKRSDT